MRSFIKLVVSPIECFRERLEGPIRWASPVLALLCCGVLLAIAESARLAGAVGEVRIDLSLLFGVGTLLVFFFMFALQTCAVVGFGLFSSQTDGWRLLEFSALAMWTQVPIAVIAMGFWAMTDVEPLGLPSGAGFLAVAEALANTGSQPTPVEQTFLLLIAYWSLWCVALQAAALRVVCRFTVGAAAAAGCVLGLLFVVLPWALQRF